ALGGSRGRCSAGRDDKRTPRGRGTRLGWMKGACSRLRGATQQRTAREARQGRVDGRTQESQRLVGRGLRAAVDMSAMGERTVIVDCDVLQADGGTRTAAITGGFVALHLAFQKAVERNLMRILPIKHFVAAASVGIVQGQPRLDLNYLEDFVDPTDR